MRYLNGNHVIFAFFLPSLDQDSYWYTCDTCFVLSCIFHLSSFSYLYRCFFRPVIVFLALAVRHLDFRSESWAKSILYFIVCYALLTLTLLLESLMNWIIVPNPNWSICIWHKWEDSQVHFQRMSLPLTVWRSLHCMLSILLTPHSLLFHSHISFQWWNALCAGFTLHLKS